MATSETAASLASRPGSASASVAVAVADDPAESTSNPQSLHRAVAARRAEYVRPHRIRVKVGTWNVAASPGTDKDLARWFVEGKGVDPKLATISPSVYKSSTAQGQDTPVAPDADSDSIQLVGGDSIGLYVLGLQEAADLYGPGLYLRPYASVDDARDKWKAALEDALPPGYQFVSCTQMAGLVLLVYASPEVAPTISNVSSATVGTGLMGLLGNKGAIATRIVLGETTKVVFVNCHLASGHDQTAVDRRVWDVMAIQARAKFEPISHAGVSEEEGDIIGDEDFAFWFGDLNFRLESLPGDDIRRLLLLHTLGEYDVEGKGQESPLEGEGVVVRGSLDSSQEGSEPVSTAPPAASTQDTSGDHSSSLPSPDSFDPDSDPHNDPASLQATLDSLLPHDQLQRVMKERKAFHDGWREGPITFLPSYKYDVGTVNLFDSSEKRRAPSWCDRILYRTRNDRENYERKVREEEEARRKDEEMKARGMEHAGDDDQVLFDYDPDNDGDEQIAEGRAGLDYDEYDVEGDSDEQVQPNDGGLDRLHLDVYTSHQRITSSDHKPVISVFTLDYDAVVPDLKAKVHAEVARELDRAENEGRPGLTIVIDGHESRHRDRGSQADFLEDAVDLGEVRFRVKQEASVTLANTGRVPATFSFVDTPAICDDEDGEPGRGSWLTTALVPPESESGEIELCGELTLEPGETAKALLIASIDGIDEARRLNEFGSELEDILVLRVKGGRDYFIPVRATWSPTCIGRSLQELIRVPDGGIRSFVKSRSKEAAGQTGTIPSELPVHLAAPKELFRLTEAVESLTERALADEQMLEECKIPDAAGWPFDETTWKYSDVSARRDLLTAVVDALDSETPVLAAFPPESPSLDRLEVVSEVLLLFLGSLTDGIIPAPLWAKIEQAPLAILGRANVLGGKASPDNGSLEDDKAAVLEVLSTAPNHNISFVFLTTTLARVVSELAPLSKDAIEALRTTSGATVALGRRSLSFRRNVATPPAEAVAALQKRQAKERRFAEIFGKVVCRTALPAKDKERKAVEDRQRAVMGLFLKPRDDV